MNIYLDIDGVLLANEKQAAMHADEFLQAVLAKYPDSTYWLTTHCWRGENRTMEVLRPVLQAETTELVKKIKPTDWGDLKTDAIDFSQPFKWFDDDLLPAERQILTNHNSLGSWIEVDLMRNSFQLRELTKSL